MSGPAAHLVGLLAEERRRGAPFHEASPRCVALANSGARDDMADWLEALQQTRSTWQASYTRREPTRMEQRLSLVANGDDRVPLPWTCEHCGELMPERGRRGRRYCRDACRKAAAARRAALAA